MNTLLCRIRRVCESFECLCCCRICQAVTDHVDVVQQRGRQPVRIQNADPEICSQICRIQVSFVIVTPFTLSNACFCKSFRSTSLCLIITQLESRDMTVKSADIYISDCVFVCPAANRMLRSSCVSSWTVCTTRSTGSLSGREARWRTLTTCRKSSVPLAFT